MHNAQVIRIAVALAALRFKPSTQTYESYVLDLRTKFPLQNNIHEETDSWRERAISLEKEMQILQERYESEHTELVALRTKPTPTPDQTPSSPLPAGAGNKKKAKKKAHTKTSNPPVSDTIPGTNPSLQQLLTSIFTSVDPGSIICSFAPHVIGFLADLDGFDTESYLPGAFGSAKLLGSLQVLDLLMERATERKNASLNAMVLATTDRILDAVSTQLLDILPPAPLPSSATLPEALSQVLPQTLTATLTLLLGAASGKSSSRRRKCTEEDRQLLDDLLGRLSSSILVPIISAFFPLSELYLLTLFSKKKKKQTHPPLPEETDIRPHILALLRKTTEALQEIASAGSATIILHIRNLLELLALEAIRELERLYAATTIHGANVGEILSNQKRPNLLLKLAKKDSVWYLCNIVHIMVSTSDSLPSSGCSSSLAPSHEDDNLLADAIFTALSALLRRTRAVPCHTTSAGALVLVNDEDIDDHGDDEICGLKPRKYGVMDEVERGMVLAVIERTWLGT